MGNQARFEFNIARLLILSASITILALPFVKSGDIRFHFRVPKIVHFQSDIEAMVEPVMPGIPKDVPSYDFVLSIVYGVKTMSTKQVQEIDSFPIEHGDDPYLPSAEKRLDQGPFQEQKALPSEAEPNLPAPSGFRIIR